MKGHETELPIPTVLATSTVQSGLGRSTILRGLELSPKAEEAPGDTMTIHRRAIALGFPLRDRQPGFPHVSAVKKT